MPLEITHVRYRGRCSNCFSVPEILRSTCNAVTPLIYSAVWPQRTRGVGQWVLKRTKKIEKTPTKNHVVVHGDQKAHDCRSNPHPSQVGVNSFPHTDWSFTDALANSEFQKEQWYAEQDQAEKIRDEKCTCGNQRHRNQHSSTDVVLRSCYWTVIGCVPT